MENQETSTPPRARFGATRGEAGLLKAERILYYTDLSPEADEAFPLAAFLARSQGAAHLHVLHVLYSPYRFHGEIIGPGLAMNLNPGIMLVAQRALRERYESALGPGIEVSFHVTNGVANIEVLRFIRKNGLDQIVVSVPVARRELPAVPKTLEAVLVERCPCPVLFISPGRRRKARGASFPSSDTDRSNVVPMDPRRGRRQRGTRRGACG